MRSLPLTALLLLAAAGPAAAQPQAPAGGRPTFSPYLNLLRGAGNGSAGPALNYFGLVQPQIQARQQANQLQTQLNQTNQAVAGLSSQVNSGPVDPSQFVTGRGAVFGSYGHWYPSIGGGGGGGGGGFGGSRAGAGGGGTTGVGRLAAGLGGAGRGAGAVGGGAGAGGGRAGAGGAGGGGRR